MEHKEDSTLRFWLVWNEQNRPPMRQHWDQNAAELEAERLARLHPGQRIHVLELSGTCQTDVTPVNWAKAVNQTDEMPF